MEDSAPCVATTILPFKVVRTNGHEEIVARTNNLLVGRAAFETARRLYPNERVDYRDGARIIAHSEPEKSSPEMKGNRR
jgi:hypothetical protein